MHHSVQVMSGRPTALLAGRHTFELARSFGEWPYGQTPVVVLSSRLASLTRTYDFGFVQSKYRVA